MLWELALKHLVIATFTVFGVNSRTVARLTFRRNELKATFKATKLDCGSFFEFHS